MVDLISPADDPALARVSAHGLCIHLTASSEDTPMTLLLPDLTEPLTAPNGVIFAPAGTLPAPLSVPPLKEDLIVLEGGSKSWVGGRAGMLYRDLIPGRLGGRFIASHIRIVEGGMVPDYVHYHRVRLQFIYCLTGWVRVVYEGQGESFLLEPGDLVLQVRGVVISSHHCSLPSSY
jgi:hypothetical protein